MIGALLGYLPSLALTLVLEGAVVHALARREARRQCLWACFALNLLTHPTVTLLAWRLPMGIIPLELLAFVVEGVGYAALLRIGTARALGYAAAANLVSALAGIGLSIVRMA